MNDITEDLKALRLIVQGCEQARFNLEANAIITRVLDECERLQKDAVKSERFAINLGDLLARYSIVMRAAVVAAAIEGPEAGMIWIENTLDGPDNLPDVDDARELGGAQALFDKEIAELTAFRAAHPPAAMQEQPR